MSQTADIVIIGAGIQGASAAYHLARRGVGTVVVLERSEPGVGATPASASMIMHQTGDEVTTELACESIRRYERFSDEVGVDITVTRTGSVLFSANATSAARLSEVAEHQRKLKIPTEEMGASEIAALSGGLLQTETSGFGIYCSADGYVHAPSVVEGYLRAAQRNGARVRSHVKATDIATQGDRVVAVQTSAHDRILTSCVVNCAGGSAREVASWVGVDLPLQNNHRNMLILKRRHEEAKPFPIFEDFDGGWYFRHHDDGVMLGIGPTTWVDDAQSSAPARYDDAIDPAVDAYLGRYAPDLLAVDKLVKWAGYRPMLHPGVRTATGTPDEWPILGRVPGLEGYFHSCGWGAFGVTLGPIGGDLIAGIVCGARSAIDASRFAWSRFDGQLPLTVEKRA